MDCTAPIKFVPTIEELTKPSPKTLEVCTICQKEFNGKSALKVHLRRTHKREDKSSINKQYYCVFETCNHSLSSSMPFSSFAAIKQHYRLVHSTERFKCGICSKDFKTKHASKQHEAECGIKYECSCNVEYTTKRGFLDHIRRQNHKIPKSLKSLFEPKKKPVKTQASDNAFKRATGSSRFILPKTFKRKVRLFHVNSSNALILPKPTAPTITTPMSSLNFKPTVMSTAVTYPSFRIAMPSCASQQIQTIPSGCSVSVQFPPPNEQKTSQTSDLFRTDLSKQTPFSHTDNSDWSCKNISIQTDENFDSVSWLNIEDEVEKILFENIATQTTESWPLQNATETDSAMCQTELPDALFNDANHLYQNNNNNFTLTNPNTVCDAQNQTIMDNCNDLLSTCSLQTFEGIPQQMYSNVPAHNNPCHISTNMETQTDQSANQSTTETQTVQQLLNNLREGPISTEVAEMSTLDVFLNNIETQTDMFLSPWHENQVGNFVNSCTQTPDADFLSEILNLDD